MPAGYRPAWRRRLRGQLALTRRDSSDEGRGVTGFTPAGLVSARPAIPSRRYFLVRIPD